MQYRGLQVCMLCLHLRLVACINDQCKYYALEMRRFYRQSRPINVQMLLCAWRATWARVWRCLFVQVLGYLVKHNQNSTRLLIARCTAYCYDKGHKSLSLLASFFLVRFKSSVVEYNENKNLTVLQVLE